MTYPEASTATQSMTKPATHCEKCAEEVRHMGAELDEIMDPNEECVLCGEPTICPHCCLEQDERFAHFPSFVCMDCIAQADRYLQHIDEVNRDINSTLRLREAMGWTPKVLIVDATLQSGSLEEIPLKVGRIIKMSPVPMVFAVATVFMKDGHAGVDWVDLCPHSLRDHFTAALKKEERMGSVRMVEVPLRSEGNA